MRPGLVLLASAAVFGQALPEKFLRYDTPLAEKTAAMPGRYAASTGQRAALLGREDGTLEAWLYPVKIFRDLRLSVYVDNALEPTPLAEFTERAVHSPGRVTLVHAHAAFTIRQTWVASVDQPWAAIVLDIETSRPLRLRLSLVPEMKPMWPASFGGQSSAFDAAEKVFVLGEGTRRFRGVLGCPLFARASEQIGHQLPDRTVLLEMDVPLETAQRSLVPIVLAPSREAYKEAAAKVKEWVEASDRYYEEFDRRTVRVTTGNATLDRAFHHARFALEKGWACNEGLGCGLIAGWGGSGLSERPGFGWYFGGDAFMNSWAILDYGDFTRVRALLEFLRDRQRDDGKMPHEWTQSAALIDWPKYPYGYYHADTTPLFVYSAWRYVERSGDRAFLEQSWPAIGKAWKWCLTALDEDGLLSNRKGGAAATETGALSGKVEKDIYLQGAWLAAARGFGAMAQMLGRGAEQKEAGERYAVAARALESWFLPGLGHWPFARLRDGSTYAALSGWMAFPLGHGALAGDNARRAAAALNRPALATDWGVRLLATDSPFYDALSYNDGSVWPFVTGFVIQAAYRQGRPDIGLAYLLGLAAVAGKSGHGSMPEYLSGDRYQALQRSVPQQLFSSSPLVEGVVSGLLGLSGDAVSGSLRVDPRTPASWPQVTFENYRVGTSTVRGAVRREPKKLMVRLHVEGAPLRVSVAPQLEPGARFSGAAAQERTFRGEAEFQFAVEPGVEILPDPRLEVGEPARMPRVVGLRVSPDEVVIEREDPAGVDPERLKIRPADGWRAEGEGRIVRYRRISR